MSGVRTGKHPTVTEVALHCLLRWLAGGSHLNIQISVGISTTSFYACIHKCIDAILQCNGLEIKFPKLQGEIEECAQKFKSISTDGVIDGCVACIDGMLLPIRTPSSNETGNVMSYYSSHYAEFGISIQAACDSSCRFVYVSVSAPGRTSDVVALRKYHLSQLRIRIEMTFGRFMNKWQLFQHPLQVKLNMQVRFTCAQQGFSISVHTKPWRNK